MAIPDPLLSLADELGDVFRQAEADVLAQLRAALADTTVLSDGTWAKERTVRRLREVLQTVQTYQADLPLQVRAWVERNMPAIYEAGGAQGAAALGGQFTWTRPHIDALGHLAADTFTDCLEATRYMDRDVKALIRAAARQATTGKVAQGRTARQAGVDLRRRLLDRGISAVTYRDGRRVRASTYAEMVARTKSAVAYNVGTLNTGVLAGVRYYELGDGLDCGLSFHDDPTLADGLVVTAEVAGTFPISHPNCVRDVSPRPDLTTDAEAAEAMPSGDLAASIDQAQNADYWRRREDMLRYLANPADERRRRMTEGRAAVAARARRGEFRAARRRGGFTTRPDLATT